MKIAEDVRLVSNEQLVLKINGRLKDALKAYAQSQGLKMSGFVKGLIIKELVVANGEASFHESLGVSSESNCTKDQ